jgi:hypothetical protein
MPTKSENRKGLRMRWTCYISGALSFDSNSTFSAYCSKTLTSLRELDSTEPSFVHRKG